MSEDVSRIIAHDTSPLSLPLWLSGLWAASTELFCGQLRIMIQYEKGQSVICRAAFVSIVLQIGVPQAVYGNEWVHPEAPPVQDHLIRRNVFGKRSNGWPRGDLVFHDFPSDWTHFYLRRIRTPRRWIIFVKLIVRQEIRSPGLVRALFAPFKKFIESVCLSSLVSSLPSEVVSSPPSSPQV